MNEYNTLILEYDGYDINNFIIELNDREQEEDVKLDSKKKE